MNDELKQKYLNAYYSCDFFKNINEFEDFVKGLVVHLYENVVQFDYTNTKIGNENYISDIDDELKYRIGWKTHDDDLIKLISYFGVSNISETMKELDMNDISFGIAQHLIGEVYEKYKNLGGFEKILDEVGLLKTNVKKEWTIELEFNSL